MDEAAIQRVVNFSTYLRNSADVILEKSGKVSLDTWILYEIEEAFSLIFEVDKYTNFHVLPPNTRDHLAIPQIQFLYDILQKIQKLRLLTKPDQLLPVEQQINLKCFRNVNTLEIDYVPIEQLKGLQNLRPTLKFFTANGVSSSMSKVLIECGADKATEYNWECLEVANFSRNPLKCLDSSLRLLSAIKILDLSFCQLSDAHAVFCLPTIIELNLSFNQISSIPFLSEAASNSLLILNLSNNLIVDLKGVERFTNLIELNLKENLLCVDETLLYLEELPHVRSVNLIRNPITFNVNYRDRLLGFLNPATKFNQELLVDDTLVLASERKEIGQSRDIPSNSNSSAFQLIKFLTEKVSNFVKTSSNSADTGTSAFSTTSRGSTSTLINSVIEDEKVFDEACNVKSTPKVAGRRKSRKNRTRHISISDPAESFVPISSPNISSILDSHHEVLFPDYIIAESTKTPFNTPVFSNLYMDDSDPGDYATAPSHSDKLLEEILISHANNAANDLVSPLPSDDWPKERENSDPMSSSTCSFSRVTDSCSRQLSEDSSVMAAQDDESTLANESHSLVAKRPVMNCHDSDEKFELVYLTICDKFYKEKESPDGSTLLKLKLSSLRGMTVLNRNPYEVQLNFDNCLTEVFPKYLYLQEEDFQWLNNFVEPIIRRNSSKAPLNESLPCKICGFSYIGNIHGEGLCASCANQVNATPVSINDFIFDNNNINKNKLKIDQDDSFNYKLKDTRLACFNITKRKNKNVGLSSDSSESVSVCSSSEAYTGSLIRRGSGNMDQISNPSASSIEILSEANHAAVDDSLGLSRAKCNAAPETALPSVKIEPNELNEGLDSSLLCLGRERVTLMQESSSSGSMTGSVCTAVGRSTAPATPLRANKLDENDSTTDNGTHGQQNFTTLREAFSNVSEYDSERRGIVFGDPTKSVSLLPWREELPQCYASYAWEWWEEINENVSERGSTPINFIRFTYNDFTSVDHRLKLHCEVFLFTESQETLQGLVKSVAVVEKEKPFMCLFVVSTHKVYILKIKNEETFSFEDWLDNEVCCFLKDVPLIETLYFKQGIILALKEKTVLLFLGDPQVTNAFLRFLLDSLERFNNHPLMDDAGARMQSQRLRQQIEEMEVPSVDSSIHLFQTVSLLKEDGSCSNSFLVITASHLILFEADLSWFFHCRSDDSIKQSELAVTSCYPLDDVTQIEAYSDCHLKLDFYQSRASACKNPWHIHVASSWVGSNIVLSLRPLWVDMLKVELDMICYSDDLVIVREILRDSPFQCYLPKQYLERDI